MLLVEKHCDYLFQTPTTIKRIWITHFFFFICKFIHITDRFVQRQIQMMNNSTEAIYQWASVTWDPFFLANFLFLTWHSFLNQQHGARHIKKKRITVQTECETLSMWIVLAQLWNDLKWTISNWLTMIMIMPVKWIVYWHLKPQAYWINCTCLGLLTWDGWPIQRPNSPTCTAP